MNDAIKMQVSAFVDGELPENEAELLVRRLSQDYELRQQVADYLGIGRVMRGETGVAGVECLRERIAAELDERPSQYDADRAPASDSLRLLRPLTGVAIAATVALVAILGLRQMTIFEGPRDDELPDVATNVTDDGYTEPPVDEMLLQYWRIHGEVASDFGTRLVTLQFGEDFPAEEVPAAADDPTADAADDSAPASNQPQ